MEERVGGCAGVFVCCVREDPAGVFCGAAPGVGEDDGGGEEGGQAFEVADEVGAVGEGAEEACSFRILI